MNAMNDIDDTKPLLAAIEDAARDLDGLESGELLKRAADVIRALEKTECAAITDGGPAFPRPDFHSDTHFTAPAQDGMSLRDYLAGQALAGVLRSEEGSDGEPVLNGRACQEYARQSYALSDAMLRERVKKGGAS